MKITIDTKKDSKHEIQHAIRMLSAVLGAEKVYTNSEDQAKPKNIFESGNSFSSSDQSSDSSSGLFSMFSQPEHTKNDEEPEEKQNDNPGVIIEY